ncbi:NAD-dependent epimerase/dehydratase [Campylobacter sp. RM13119]|uniref:NAD-dependent epimerase/dehydratase n=1 Tax=Campylobacter californiensis TaxID=1032243 RepID=UPI00147279CC|nr:NAD-dependent epimerase/dehydratase [Campylobacter sp. RM13119]MBE3605364.1 NAD-dependent epimerase/dehydratase [Campylobacter sp. RM13119]
MTILITGSTGFLGSYLLKSFAKKDYEVIALKRSTSNTYRISDYLSSIKIYDTDKTDLLDIFENHKIDIVVNTVTNYGRSDSKPSSITSTNLLFGLNLLEISVGKIKAFINTDTLLDRNINAYSLSKAQLVDWMQFLSNKSTKIINIKIEHMYGPLDDENKFIYWLINQLKRNIEKINLTSGIQKRDFIYVDDVVNAYEAIIENINTFSNFEEFELGTGKSVEVRSFIEKIYKEISSHQYLSTKLDFGVIPYRDNENMDMQADIKKLVNLGWKPKKSIGDGIKKILREKR